MKPKTTPYEQQITFTCDQCNKRVGVRLAHYEIARCVCGKRYWALRPLADGPLVAHPYPEPRFERLAA